MPREVRRKYAINFDLKIADLEKYYSATNPKSAYKEISKYMSKHGFFIGSGQVIYRIAH